MATIALHNYLRQTDNASYCPCGFLESENSSGEIIPGHWRREIGVGSSAGSDGVVPVPTLRGSRRSENALQMRDCLMEYVNSDTGSLNWQVDYVRRT